MPVQSSGPRSKEFWFLELQEIWKLKNHHCGNKHCLGVIDIILELIVTSTILSIRKIKES